MDPNLQRFMRRDDQPNDAPGADRPPSASANTENVSNSVNTARNQTLGVPTDAARRDQDILSDQFRLLSPRGASWMSSPPPLDMATFAPSLASLGAGQLPGPAYTNPEHTLEGQDLWFTPELEFLNAQNFGPELWQQPNQGSSPETSSGPGTASGVSPSAFASSATSASATDFPSSLPPESRACDRRTLQLIHFFFHNLAPGLLLSPTQPGGGVMSNPWQRLVLPLTYGSEPLRNVVCAISSTHLEAMGAVASRASTGYRAKAVESLAAVRRQDGPEQLATCLATRLLLIHHDSMVGRDLASIVSHIQAGHHLLSLPRDKDDQVMSFLERVFHLYDVSIALSQGTEPIADFQRWKTISASGAASVDSRPSPQSTPSPSALPHSINPQQALTATSSSLVDSIFGLTLGLWPILHRLSALRSLTAELHEAIAARQNLKIAVLRAEHQSLTTAIGTSLERWYPFRRPGDPSPSAASPSSVVADDPEFASSGGRTLTAQLAISYHHAMSYRESALVYLHRAVRGVALSHEHVRQSALASIHHCTAALQQGSTRVPLWPLFIAACNLEAVGGDDGGGDQGRFFVSQTFQLMAQTPQAAAARHLWSVVANVWSRLDAIEAGDEEHDAFTVWRDIGQSMGLIVFLA